MPDPYRTSGYNLIQNAIDVISDKYGDEVSVEQKKKNLFKFGRNASVGTTGATIMTLAGSETEETYVNRNLITTISSSSAGVIMFEPYAIIPKNADIRVFATASAASTDVEASIFGFLAKVIS